VVIVASESITSNGRFSTSAQTSQILHQPRDAVRLSHDFPITSVEIGLETPMTLVLCKEGPNAFTGIGEHFDDFNTMRADTNIPTIENEDEEIDLDAVDPLSQDCLSFLIDKHEEDVWGFMRR